MTKEEATKLIAEELEKLERDYNDKVKQDEEISDDLHSEIRERIRKIETIAKSYGVYFDLPGDWRMGDGSKHFNAERWFDEDSLPYKIELDLKHWYHSQHCSY